MLYNLNGAGGALGGKDDVATSKGVGELKTGAEKVKPPKRPKQPVDLKKVKGL